MRLPNLDLNPEIESTVQKRDVSGTYMHLCQLILKNNSMAEIDLSFYFLSKSQ